MSQQTQVERVVDPYLRFMERFPNPREAAEAGSAEVVRAWAGLGYNRRAIMLHAAATRIVDHHDGVVPDQLEALLALPGVGPYTARAVLAFAFERDVAVLDTNVGRVLARLVGRPLSAREAQELADDLVPAGFGWEWNQAILDFGASCCRKRQPICDGCPSWAVCCYQGVGEDPAVGSAGVSARQSRFEGSDRQGRGRLVDALRSGPLTRSSLPGLLGWNDDVRVDRVVVGLLDDGLIEVHGDELRLA